jgi:plastocyanin
MRLRLTLLLAMIGTACNGDGPSATREVATVQITTSTATLEPGETSQFTAVALDAGGVTIPNAGAPAWSSSATSVASVDQTGLVLAVTLGTASISATISGKTGSRLVTVLMPDEAAVVTMPGESFIPFQVNVRVGQLVYFEFPQNSHNVIFQRKNGAPADIQETSNVTISRQFNIEGQFPYDCTLHPGMSGVIVVDP